MSRVSEMIDRIRRELHERGGYATPWESCSQCEDAARSILELMRDPPNALIEAGIPVDLSHEDERSAVINLWHAMISEALK